MATASTSTAGAASTDNKTMNSTTNPSTTSKSTFKALSVSYADRIRPKSTESPYTGSPNTSSADVSDPSSPFIPTKPDLVDIATMPSRGVLSETGAARQHSAAASNGESVRNGGPSSKGKATSEVKDTRDRSTDLVENDDEGWQAVTVKGRGSRSQIQQGDDKKTKDGGRWNKKADTTNPSPPTSSRQSKDRGKSWADLMEEDDPSPAHKADNWRSSALSRSMETPGAIPSGYMDSKVAEHVEPMKDAEELPQCQAIVASSSAVTASHNSNSAPFTPHSTEDVAAAEDQSTPSTGIDGNWRRSHITAAKVDLPTEGPSAPASVVNVWQVRKDQMTTANPRSSIKPTSAANVTTSSTNPIVKTTQHAQSTGPNPRGATGAPTPSASKRKANQAKSAETQTDAASSRRQPAATISDISAWPEVQLSAAAKTSTNNQAKTRDDAESVASNVGLNQGSGKKDKIRWIPIPASELQLSPDKPERSRRSGGSTSDTNGRIRRAANGPPERTVASATGRPVTRGQATRKGGPKATTPNGALSSKKSKSSNKSQAPEATDSSLKSGQPSSNEKTNREGSRTSSINLPSESGEPTLTVEVKLGVQVPEVNETAYTAVEAAPDLPLSQRESLSMGPRELANGTSYSAAEHVKIGNLVHGDSSSFAGISQSRGGGFGGVPRGGRGMRGARGWRGGPTLSPAYVPSNRARSSMSPPTHVASLNSTSLPVSNNVSPRLLPTFTPPYYGDVGLSFVPAYPYQQSYYGYAPMAYAPYPQEPAMYDQPSGASFAALGPPPPMPVTMVPGLDALRVRILGQLEYYFGDQNLPMDFFLRQQMDSNGWIDIAMVASFNRVKSLSTDLDLIKEILQLSSVVEVRDEKVRLAHGKHKSWVLPDAGPSPFIEEQTASGDQVVIMGTSGILSSDFSAEARDRIAGDVTRDVLRAGSSAALESRINGIFKIKDEDEVSGSATGTDLATGEPTPATSVDGEGIDKPQ